jgi:hypothetical protein
MSNEKAITELGFVFGNIENMIEYHREEAHKHTAIADVLFGLSNKIDKRRGELEDMERVVEI